jgi:hypothetical protein
LLNLLGDNIDTIKRNTQTLTDATKEIGLEVNTKKTKYMLLSHDQNEGQNHNIKIGNKCSEDVEHFRYLGTTITNRKLIQEEIKRRLNSAFMPFFHRFVCFNTHIHEYRSQVGFEELK